MTIIELSSKDVFISNLLKSIDNEHHIIRISERKYKGELKFGRFKLPENYTSQYRSSFYRITGTIEKNEVGLTLKLHRSIYLQIVLQVIWFLSFIVVALGPDQPIALIFIIIGLISTGFWLARLLRRREAIIEHFMQMGKAEFK